MNDKDKYMGQIFLDATSLTLSSHEVHLAIADERASLGSESMKSSSLAYGFHVNEVRMF